MCNDCRQASERWDWDGYSAGCEGCTVRMLARATYQERDRLAPLVIPGTAQADRVRMHELVRAEEHRLKALHAQCPVRWWQR